MSTRTMKPLGLVATVVVVDVVDVVDPPLTVVEVELLELVVEVVRSPNVVTDRHADTEPP